MAKFLFQARYTTDGAKGLAKDGGTSRRAAIEKMCAEAGGKLESFYFAFGDVDAYVTCDLPDTTTAAAVALAVNQAGRASTTTTVLLTPEDFDKAAKKSVSYRPPGG
ncbi:MAG TPA: GYD domain-containing protein [Casimicrobiaceae bacterium]|jgi:uncharacterized protein with GYD domain